MPIDILSNAGPVFLKASETEQFKAAGASQMKLEPPGVEFQETTGILTAPSVITAQRNVYVVARNSGGNEIGRVTVILSPPVNVSPASVDLDKGQAQQFQVEPRDQQVTWTIAPGDVGNITETGVYTAPRDFKRWPTVVVTACRKGDGTHTGNATIRLVKTHCWICFAFWYWVVLLIAMGGWAACILSKVSMPANGLDVALSPPIITMCGTQWQQFAATVLNATDETGRTVIWLPPEKGTINSNGLYTAPAKVESVESLAIKAVSASDSRRFGSAVVILSPTSSLLVQPNAVTIRPLQTVPFLAKFGSSTTSTRNVEWSVSPSNAGTVSAEGLFTAADAMPSPARATILAKSSDDANVRAAATVAIMSNPEGCTPCSKELLKMVFFIGMLGSLLHAIWSFVTYLGNQQFRVSWLWWYFFRPWLGGGMAVLVFFLVSGGMIKDNSAGNVSWVIAVSGLVGMFSEHVSLKLKEVVENIFPVKDMRKDKADKTK